MAVVAGAASDPGRVRPNNEDSYVVVRRPSLVGGLDLLLVVADGMGGHLAGEVASRMIVDRFISAFRRDDDQTVGARSHPDWRRELDRVIQSANDAIYRAAGGDTELHGMGSTVVAGVIDADRLYLGNVGDSRAYLIHDETIYQLSQDHSWVAEQVRSGLISASEAKVHPRKNILTRAVGSMPEVQPDTSTFELMAGDLVLLCTDGLTNVVTDQDLVDATRAHPPERAAEKLVELARRRGAPDNVTVVIAQYRG